VKLLRPLSIVGAAGAVLAAGVYLTRARDLPPAPVAEAPVDAGIEAWCASGLTPIEGGGCFAAPRDLEAPQASRVQQFTDIYRFSHFASGRYKLND